MDGAARGDREQRVRDTGARCGAHVLCRTRVTHRKAGTHRPADSSPPRGKWKREGGPKIPTVTGQRLPHPGSGALGPSVMLVGRFQSCMETTHLQEGCQAY